MLRVIRVFHACILLVLFGAAVFVAGANYADNTFASALLLLGALFVAHTLHIILTVKL